MGSFEIAEVSLTVRVLTGPFAPVAVCRGWRRRETIGAEPPINDLGLVDLKPRVVGGGEARRVADGAIDIDGFSTGAAD